MSFDLQNMKVVHGGECSLRVRTGLLDFLKGPKA
jgi:hypothetical protein